MKRTHEIPETAKMRGWILQIVASIAMWCGTGTAYAGPVGPYGNGPWLEFAFREVGTTAEPCVTPGGPICFVWDSNTVLLDTPPPWTFEAGPGGAIVKVVDVALTGDRFAVYDNGALLGVTSDVPPNFFCGLSADPCLTGSNGSFGSSGAFPVGAGQHAIEIKVLLAVSSAGAAYFRVDGDVIGAPPPPPPPDVDADGIIDEQDACPASDLSPTVVIQDCDSGVPNTLSPAGCTILDGIHACGNGVRNHGLSVSCVAQFLDGLKRAGVVTGAQHGAIQRCVARNK